MLNGLLPNNSLTGSFDLHILGVSICYILSVKKWILAKSPEI
jgi:hypothetical protein